MTYYIIIAIIIIFFLFIGFLYLLNSKITKFEKKIIKDFNSRNNNIYPLYEVTKWYIQKHKEVFQEILNLKNKDLNENYYINNLFLKINSYKLIHNELNFIFRVSNKNQKLIKNEKFLYLRDCIIDNNSKISNQLELYKKIVKKFNRLILIKNITIIWLLFPINKKEEVH